MNLPFAKKPGATEPELEAMAPELNGRGTPYRLGETVFPPGEWVPVTTSEAEQLQWRQWAELREKEAG